MISEEDIAALRQRALLIARENGEHHGPRRATEAFTILADVLGFILTGTSEHEHVHLFAKLAKVECGQVDFVAAYIERSARDRAEKAMWMEDVRRTLRVDRGEREDR